VASLLALEEERLLAGAVSAEGQGADPFLLLADASGRFLGGLRGESRIVLLDGRGRELASADAPAGLTGWSRVGSDTLLAVGEQSSEVHAYAITDTSIAQSGAWLVEQAYGLRDVEVVGEHLYLADRHRSRILVAPLPRAPTPAIAPTPLAECHGALQLEHVADLLVATCLLDHRLLLWPLASDGAPLGSPKVIEHDGPLWSVALTVGTAGIELVATGIEDHPLDRSDGSFGYIDSFAFVYHVERGGSGWRHERVASINLSEHGVITPKWVGWEAPTRFVALAYGSAAAARVELSGARPEVETLTLPPGSAAMAGQPGAGLVANPLLDAWIVWDGPDTEIVTAGPPRDPELVLGEALVFTDLMAPFNAAEGRSSRFTCEACHFEATVDGRTHHTGRGSVHATTKTLRGLVGNRPHFSRALDDTSAEMIFNEFRVAGRGSGVDPWFSVARDSVPWLPWDDARRGLSPWDLRVAMLRFLATLAPEANPRVRGRNGFTAREREGAALFAEHCETCHQARTQTDAPSSRVSSSAWERAIFEGGEIRWASDERSATGVEPYVHSRGARTPALQRLYAKYPYFTHGGRKDLRDLLAALDLGPPFLHEGGTAGRALTEREIDALEAFLHLL